MKKLEMNKSLDFYMSLPYHFAIEKVVEDDGTQYFVVSNPELPGCVSDGETLVEAFLNLRSAREDYIAALLNWGDSVPLPKQEAVIRYPSEEKGVASVLPSNHPRPSMIERVPLVRVIMNTHAQLPLTY